MGKRVFGQAFPKSGWFLGNEVPRCLELRKKSLETNSRLQMDPRWILTVSGSYHKPTKLYKVSKSDQKSAPVIFEFGASPVKSLRNCKKLQNRLSVPDLGSKNGLQILDFQRNSCLQKFFFLTWKNSAKSIFFPSRASEGEGAVLELRAPRLHNANFFVFEFGAPSS